MGRTKKYNTEEEKAAAKRGKRTMMSILVVNRLCYVSCNKFSSRSTSIGGSEMRNHAHHRLILEY